MFEHRLSFDSAGNRPRRAGRYERPRSIALIALVVLLSASGCRTNSVNKAQFDRLRLGMNPTEVEEILGKGAPLDEGQVQRLMKESMPPDAGGDSNSAAAFPVDWTELRGMRFGSERKNVSVIFRNDRLFRAFQQGL